MPMKLALCLYKYFPHGGLQRDFLRILNECRSRGHAVHVYTAEWQGEPPNDFQLTVFPSSRIGGNHRRDKHFHEKMQKALTAQHFDAVVGFNKMPGLDLYYGADYCYLGRALPQYAIYGPLYRVTPRYRDRVAFEKAVFGRDSQTQILSLSEREKTVYQQHYFTPEERFHLLPPTLAPDRKPVTDRTGTRIHMRQEMGIGTSDTLLLFIGSGFKTKGLDRVLRALSHLPESLSGDTHLVVIGQDQTGPYRRLAHKLQIADRVRFLGGRTDIPELLAAGDLLVHPAYMENTGTILLEAIASGLPVIATDVCGYASHIIQADAGKVLPSPFDQDQLNQELTAALVAKNRETWSTNGIRYGANPTLYRMPGSAVNAIESVTNRRRRDAQVAVADIPADPCLFLRTDLGHIGDFPKIMELEGETFRKAPGRKTVRFSRQDQRYFLKTHTGVGWQEIIKNLVYFRLPVIGAMNEWHGAHHLQRLGIDTLSIAGYGNESGNPAHRQSFIITDEISHAQSLEEFCSTWKHHPPRRAADVRFKRWLIQRLAQTARQLHKSGANHRDFYLCHFLLQPGYESNQLSDRASRLFVIDLHRMQLRRRTPPRWKIKDVAGLHYSSMDLGLTRRDKLRFIKLYRPEQSLRETLASDARFWHRVDRRAQRLYQAERRRAPNTDIAVARALHGAGTQP